MRLPFSIRTLLRNALLLVCALMATVSINFAQQPKPLAKPTEKSIEGPPKQSAKESTPQIPAQIEMLETKLRFETDGSSRKEVHARVHINNELGARQFGRLNFTFNRAYESVEIPLVRIAHASGGTADILPSAITDIPDPAVADAPAYQDIRLKSVRILGLKPTDTLEYRIITTTTNAPMAPDFWASHTFDRSGVTLAETYELDLPENKHALLKTIEGIPPELDLPETKHVRIKIADGIPPGVEQITGTGPAARWIRRWEKIHLSTNTDPTDNPNLRAPDISLTTFTYWDDLLKPILSLWSKNKPGDATKKKAEELCSGKLTNNLKMTALYDFAATQIRTVDLPLSATGFRLRAPDEILSSGYGTPYDKLKLLEAMSSQAAAMVIPAFVSDTQLSTHQPVLPSLLTNVIGVAFVHSDPSPPNEKGEVTVCDHCGNFFWLDPGMEVAPFAVIRSDFRGKPILFAGSFPGEGTKLHDPFRTTPQSLPYPSKQKVNVDASLDTAGKLTAKVHYELSGDNELLLRVAFHQAQKDKWKDLAQLLSISDGFRGEITTVNASDPLATHEPFTVDYEITMPKFVDWSKKSVRIPALLPQVGLPEPPAKAVAGSATSTIELGTPLDVETTAKLQLPEGTTARNLPTGTSVERDYATFASKYAINGSAITASRHINFILREVPGTRAPDYNAFLHAVQSDSAQLFTLERPADTPVKTNSAAPVTSTPPNKTPPTP